jgi:hypothetical protein
MSNLRRHVGGDTFQVRDCYVWAEIYYLDSLTDYRECLPHARDEPRCTVGEDLVMLDSRIRRPQGSPSKSLPLVTLGILSVLFFAALCLYC